MKFVLLYRPEVVADLDAARCWYEERSARLGSDFIVECSEALAKIKRNPEWVGVDGYGVRSLRIHRFPYVIHYRIEGPHHSPHFHAYHGDDEAVYGIAPIELLAGSLPRPQARLVEAWAKLHQSELVADWGRLQAGSEPLPIEPLP